MKLTIDHDLEPALAYARDMVARFSAATVAALPLPKGYTVKANGWRDNFGFTWTLYQDGRSVGVFDSEGGAHYSAVSREAML